MQTHILSKLKSMENSALAAITSNSFAEAESLILEIYSTQNVLGYALFSASTNNSQNNNNNDSNNNDNNNITHTIHLIFPSKFIPK